MEKTYEEAKQTLLGALPYLRHGIAEAKKEGVPKIGILATKPDSSGRVVVEFMVEEFISDLEIVLKAPQQTDEDTANAKAVQFLNEHGLKLGG
jgi:homoaconitase/3-isopropylmalate dehydratase large subunit